MGVFDIMSKSKNSAYPIPSYVDLDVEQKICFDTGGSLATPVGFAAWAWIGTKADDKFGGDPKQKITIVFDEEDPDYADFVARVLAFENAFLKAAGHKPVSSPSIIKEPDDRLSEVTGGQTGPYMVVTKKAKINADGTAVPVPLFDEFGESLTDEFVYGGDRISVELTLGGYVSKNKKIGAGIKPYLLAVQLVEKTGPKRNGAGGSAGSKFKKKAKPAPAVDGEDVTENEDVPF